ncbi:hypothetical protein [Macrococcoides bohemicum]|uniref:hypothetical protein n=1 Tax=Macrococcoides bohemicum TaxID=1903056 RepID=UPI00289CE890|nr:hypothetical protein [Macrococcus bohemicus]
MSFYERFLNDIDELKKRYPFFEMIPVNPEILTQTTMLDVDDQTKCAILAIDTSMRMQDLVDDSNKDRYVLSTDLLSALFYRYLASPFQQYHYQILTDCVAKQNELKQQFSYSNDPALKEQIDNIFVMPFMA